MSSFSGMGFGQSDMLRMQRLQQGMATAQDEVDDGTLTPDEGQELMGQIQPRLQQLGSRVESEKQKQQQEAMQQVMHQTAFGEAISHQNSVMRAQGLEQRISVVRDPETGESIHMFEEKPNHWNRLEWPSEQLRADANKAHHAAQADQAQEDTSVGADGEAPAPFSMGGAGGGSPYGQIGEPVRGDRAALGGPGQPTYVSPSPGEYTPEHPSRGQAPPVPSTFWTAAELEDRRRETNAFAAGPGAYHEYLRGRREGGGWAGPAASAGMGGAAPAPGGGRESGASDIVRGTAEGFLGGPAQGPSQHPMDPPGIHPGMSTQEEQALAVQRADARWQAMGRPNLSSAQRRALEHDVMATVRADRQRSQQRAERERTEQRTDEDRNRRFTRTITRDVEGDMRRETTRPAGEEGRGWQRPEWASNADTRATERRSRINAQLAEHGIPPLPDNRYQQQPSGEVTGPQQPATSESAMRLMEQAQAQAGHLIGGPQQGGTQGQESAQTQPPAQRQWTSAFDNARQQATSLPEGQRAQVLQQIRTVEHMRTLGNLSGEQQAIYNRLLQNIQRALPRPAHQPSQRFEDQRHGGFSPEIPYVGGF